MLRLKLPILRLFLHLGIESQFVQAFDYLVQRYLNLPKRQIRALRLIHYRYYFSFYIPKYFILLTDNYKFSNCSFSFRSCKYSYINTTCNNLSRRSYRIPCFVSTSVIVIYLFN